MERSENVLGGPPGATLTATVARRLRTVAPFNEWSEAEREALVGTGEVIEYPAGATVIRAGEHDEYLHYLLEGAVSITTADGTARLLHAGEGPARQALDDAGVKTASVVAAHPCRVFRVPDRELSAATRDYASRLLPTELYTETHSGQQLAALINELATGQSGLAEAGDAPAPAGIEASEVVPSFELAPPLGALDETAALPATPSAPVAPPGPVPAVDAGARGEEALVALTTGIEQEIRRYLAAERARYRARLEQQAARLKQRAEEIVRARQNALRERYAAAHREREQALTARYRQLLGLANQLARQKAAIYAARHQIEDKLKRAEQLHRELAELGGQVTSQLDRIDELLPGDSATDPSGPPVGPREAGH